MNVAELQAALNRRGIKPALVVDGIAGKKTMGVVDELLAGARLAVDWEAWSDARRRVAAEQIIYRDLGIAVGAIDGLVGPQTRYARDVYRNADEATWRDPDEGRPADVVPQKAAEWPREKDVQKFFGAPGSNQVMLALPFPMRLAWDPATLVHRVSVHARVKAPMERIWQRTFDHYGHARIKALRLDMYGGCLNVRKKRGGSSWSMHSFGIAWDVDPDRNQLKWGRDLASLDGPDYAPFWGFVEAEGAVSLGRALNYDWMHWQFARL